MLYILEAVSGALLTGIICLFCGGNPLSVRISLDAQDPVARATMKHPVYVQQKLRQGVAAEARPECLTSRYPLGQ
jgi:hypothetical protein